jgi:hypothetical protein
MLIALEYKDHEKNSNCDELILKLQMIGTKKSHPSPTGVHDYLVSQQEDILEKNIFIAKDQNFEVINNTVLSKNSPFAQQNSFVRDTECSSYHGSDDTPSFPPLSSTPLVCDSEESNTTVKRARKRL